MSVLGKGLTRAERVAITRAVPAPPPSLPDAFSPELRCVARAAATAAGGPAFDGIGGLAPARLSALARRHRMGAPVLELLAPLCRPHDPAVADSLAATARIKRVNAVLLTGKAAAISIALTDAGIRHLSVKGPALAQLLYGDPVARDSKDLDFLIDPAAFARAEPVVRALGFGDSDAADLPDGKNVTLWGHGLDVELHTRLVDLPELLPIDFDALWAARETVTLGGIDVPVPGTAQAMLYLCVHGAEHAWFRMRWVQDIARIVVAGPPGAIADCLALAEQLRMTGVVVAALHLVERVFGIPVPGAPPPDAATHRLVALAETALALPAHVASRPPLGWLLRKLPVQFDLRRDWAYRRAFMRHLLLSRRSFDLDPWPRWAQWVYHPLRPFLLIRSRWRSR